MRRLMLVPLATLALASCNQQPSVSPTNASPAEAAGATATKSGDQQPSVSLTNASPAEAAAETKAAGVATEMRPGKWETKIEMLELRMPGMEGAANSIAAKVKAEMMKSHTINSCLTAADVKRHGSKVFGQGNTKCEYGSYTVSGGTIDAVMTCPGPQGAMSMHMTGSFAPEAFTVEQAMEMSSPRGNVHSKARVTGKWIGDCAPGEK